MKLIYIAGPYRSTWPWPINWLGRLININRARRMAHQVWRDGHMAVCPHMNSAMMDGVCPDNNFLKCGIKLLKSCDYILILKGWDTSSGTMAELHEANRLKIPCIYEASWENKHPHI